MPRPRKSVPSYLHSKPRNLAYVSLPDGKGGRRVVYLGRYDSPESHAEYRQLIARLKSQPEQNRLYQNPVPERLDHETEPPVVNEVILAFMRFAATHYRHPDGRPTGEIDNYKRAMIPLRNLYGDTLAADFGPRALAAVRQQMIDAKLCRGVINSRIDRIKRVFKWATAEELVPVAVYESLRTLAGLRRGRSEAREKEPIKPVELEQVLPTLPHLSRHMRAMVELLRFTGMRPGEVCKFRLADVNRADEVWVFRPGQHKTAHHGRSRVIHLGPNARRVLTAFLVGDQPPPLGFESIDLVNDQTARLVAADAYEEAGRDRDAVLLRDLARPVVFMSGCVVDPASPVFSPHQAREEIYARLRKKRVTKVQPSQVYRRKVTATRLPGAEYRTHAITHAICEAAKKAGVPHWHPNQLRHLWATEVRRQFGLEGAGASLGHAKMSVTEVYAERDEMLAARIAAAMG